MSLSDTYKAQIDRIEAATNAFVREISLDGPQDGVDIARQALAVHGFRLAGMRQKKENGGAAPEAPKPATKPAKK